MNPNTPLAIITQNKRMHAIIEGINRIADSDTSVLLVGETGAGKEIFAEYIHKISNRSQQPFVKISLTALPRDLMASELFGYEKGSFTSASSNRKGLFELASGGSLFLDDIDDVPLEIQAKLLRVLESREIMRIGGTKPIPVDVRLITASKVDLKILVEQKRFRDDLFYRINVVPFEIPPLRERPDDIGLLVNHFLKKFNPGKKLKVHPLALEKLEEYSWPGNVRELRNIIHRSSLFAEEEIRPEDLPADIGMNNQMQELVKACGKCFSNGSLRLNDVVKCVENNLINDAMERTEGNQSEAAKLLGMSLSTFRDKLKKYEGYNCSAGN